MASPTDNVRTILEAETDLEGKTNLFIGREPPDPNNIVTIFDTPGEGPLLFQHKKNKDGENNQYDYVAFSVRVRNTNYDDSYAQAKELVTVLHGISHRMVGADKVHLIEALDNPSLLDWDDQNRARFVVNFAMQRTPGTET